MPFLASTAVVAFSGASDAADGQPAITPAVKCEALVGLSFASSTIVVEKAEAAPEAPAGTLQVRPPDPETVRVATPSNCRAEGVIDRRTGAGGTLHFAHPTTPCTVGLNRSKIQLRATVDLQNTSPPAGTV